MIGTPEIVRTEAVTMAKIHQVVPASEIRQVMGKTIAELKKAIADQGRAITGPWFTHHFKAPAASFDFEVCFPVSDAVEAAGRMEPGEWPAMSVARTLYRGGYEGLSAAWGELTQWTESHGHDTRPDFWERYISGPETGRDASEWTTELSRPLAER